MNCKEIIHSDAQVEIAPHVYAVKDTKKKIMHLYIYFLKDSKHPFIKSVDCYLPGRDPMPFELYTSEMETRSVRVMVDKNAGQSTAGDSALIEIKIPFAEIGSAEKFVFVDIDHEGAQHGGTATIHWP